MRPGTEIFVSAGEASGDLYAARVVRAMRRADPSFTFWGAGGEALAAEGVEIRHHASELGLTGVSALPSVAGAVGRLFFDWFRRLRRGVGCLALLVDYPGANLRLAAMAKRAGLPVLYYIAPQRWAWLGWRMGALRRYVDQLAVILPFEEAFFVSQGINARHVGHPLLDVATKVDATPRDGGQESGRKVLSLWPGSRRNELDAHLPTLAAAAQRLMGRFDLLWVAAEGAAAARCGEAFAGARCVSPAEALRCGGAALCCSGTATLQLAMAGIPMAVFYRMGPLSAALARAFVRLPYVALPNLIAGRRIVPELLQQRMTVEGLARAAERLASQEERARQRIAFAREVLPRLGEPGCAQRVAAMAIEMAHAKRC